MSNFVKGDFVRCISPISLVEKKFDLDPTFIYQVNYFNFRLEGLPFNYDSNRFEKISSEKLTKLQCIIYDVTIPTKGE
jgi:hypothetical protein